MPLRVLFASLTVCIFALFTAACGGEKLSDSRAQRQIENGIYEQLQVKVDVACPADRPLEKGDRFTCSVSSKDTDALRVRAIQTNSKGNVRWSAKLLATDDYERSIEQSIQQQRKLTVAISCPDLVSGAKDTKFTCQARDPKTGKTQEVDVVVTDSKGNITFST
jgi:hypothetical protein